MLLANGVALDDSEVYTPLMKLRDYVIPLEDFSHLVQGANTKILLTMLEQVAAEKHPLLTVAQFNLLVAEAELRIAAMEQMTATKA